MKDPKAMYALSYGLFVLTARRGEQDNGCIINTGIQVTSQPNRVLIAVNKSNFTHDMILETGAFNLSVLTEKADFSLFQRFGFQSAGTWTSSRVFPHPRTDNGLLAVTEGTSAWLSWQGRVHRGPGHHTLFVADVTRRGHPQPGAQRTLCLLPSQHQAPSRRPRRRDGEETLGVHRVRLYLRGGDPARRLHLPYLQAPRQRF